MDIYYGNHSEAVEVIWLISASFWGNFEIILRHPTVWLHASSLPDDAVTRHHCSLSGAMHLMGRETKWVMTSEVKVPSFSAKSRYLDPNLRCGPQSITGAQVASENKSASTSDVIDDPQQPPLVKCDKQTPALAVCMAAKLSPATWCSAPPPPAPTMIERRFPKLERRRRLSS